MQQQRFPNSHWIRSQITLDKTRNPRGLPVYRKSKVKYGQTHWLLLALLLALLGSGCQVSEMLPETAVGPINEPVQPTPLPLGRTRAAPLASAADLALSGWEVEILDSIRGDKAWHALQAANQFNDPPGDGWEYVLVRYRIRNTSRNAEKQSLDFHLTGSAHALYPSYRAGVVEPDPALETYLPGGATSEGWEAYRVRAGESNLMVVLEDNGAYSDPYWFVALEEGAAVFRDAALLDNLTPSLGGTEPSEPLPLTEMATTPDWQVSVQEVVSGNRAWEVVIAANQFNDPPEDGMMYVLARVRLHFIGDNELGLYISGYSSSFIMLDEEGLPHETASVSGLEPELLGELFSGGALEGWLAFQAPQGDLGNTVLLFQPRENTVENLRYLSLHSVGR